MHLGRAVRILDRLQQRLRFRIHPQMRQCPLRRVPLHIGLADQQVNL